MNSVTWSTMVFGAASGLTGFGVGSAAGTGVGAEFRGWAGCAVGAVVTVAGGLAGASGLVLFSEESVHFIFKYSSLRFR